MTRCPAGMVCIEIEVITKNQEAHEFEIKEYFILFHGLRGKNSILTDLGSSPPLKRGGIFEIRYFDELKSTHNPRYCIKGLFLR